MNRRSIKQGAAENWGLLAADGITMTTSKLTEDRVNEQINIQYQNTVGPIIANEDPETSLRFTQPNPTYTASAVVVSVTGTTLVVDTDVLRNDMEGFEIENATDTEKIKIATYTDAHTVELAIEPENDWVGDTIYVLGNEFVLIGEVTDLREIAGIRIKYNGTESDWTPLERFTDYHSGRADLDSYSTTRPMWYGTSMYFDGRKRQAFGIKPAPVSKSGKIALTYIEKMQELDNDAAIPLWDNLGVGTIIVNGVTAWGFKILGQFDRAAQYLERDREGNEVPKGLNKLLAVYKPKARSGPYKPKLGRDYRDMLSHQI